MSRYASCSVYSSLIVLEGGITIRREVRIQNGLKYITYDGQLYIVAHAGTHKYINIDNETVEEPYYKVIRKAHIS